jgi:predicted ATPase
MGLPMARWQRDTNLPAPFLKRLIALREALAGRAGEPFDAPWSHAEFELEIQTSVTIIVGENGICKFTWA